MRFLCQQGQRNLKIVSLTSLFEEDLRTFLWSKIKGSWFVDLNISSARWSRNFYKLDFQVVLTPRFISPIGCQPSWTGQTFKSPPSLVSMEFHRLSCMMSSVIIFGENKSFSFLKTFGFLQTTTLIGGKAARTEVFSSWWFLFRCFLGCFIWFYAFFGEVFGGTFCGF